MIHQYEDLFPGKSLTNSLPVVYRFFHPKPGVPLQKIFGLSLAAMAISRCYIPM